MAAVVWCVMPTPRMNAILQEQAHFIDQFITDDENTPENEGGKIWSNVVVVCKGKVCPACLPLPDVLSLSSVRHSLETCRALYWQPNTNMSTPLPSPSGTSSPAPRSWPGRM